MKGSVWNKWDLHIHSPVTWQANGYAGQCDIARYVQLLGEKQLSLIAVTNYFYFRQNELEMIREEIARQNLNITVLGNVEFRLDQQNKAGDFINVHILGTLLMFIFFSPTGSALSVLMKPCPVSRSG